MILADEINRAPAKVQSALLEAMAMGKALVVTPTDGTREVITDNVNGLIAQYNNPENLAKLYKQQFENRIFDLIIISDNNAFDFMELYYDYLFKNIRNEKWRNENYKRNSLSK